MIGGNSVGRHPPPAYNVAAQRALLHRLGRAHSHEGVTLSYCPPNALISMTGVDLSNELDVDDNGIYSHRFVAISQIFIHTTSFPSVSFQMTMVHKSRQFKHEVFRNDISNPHPHTQTHN